MAEYIEREAALALVRPDAPEDEKAAVTIATAKKLVRDIVLRTPASDVAPVVRCRECKHCDPENYHCDHPMSTAAPLSRKPDDFCSYGERKEGARTNVSE